MDVILQYIEHNVIFCFKRKYRHLYQITGFQMIEMHEISDKKTFPLIFLKKHRISGYLGISTDFRVHTGFPGTNPEIKTLKCHFYICILEFNKLSI